MKTNALDTNIATVKDLIPPIAMELPFPIAVKDENSIYVAANTTAAMLVGYKNAEQVIGVTDADAPCDAAELYETFVAQDKQVLEEGETQNLDVCFYADGQLHVLLSYKKRIELSDSKPYVYVHCTELPILTIAKLLNKLDFMIDPNSKEGSKTYKIQKQVLSVHESHQPLTTRQHQCLFYLLHGKSAKETAARLDISHRTVEMHLERLKNVFVCNTRSELVEKAIHNGLALVIPASLI